MATKVTTEIDESFDKGWQGTADDWWAEHPEVRTINSIAPHFTHLKQAGRIEPAGPRRETRQGAFAQPWKRRW